MVKAIDADRICFVCRHMRTDTMESNLELLRPGRIGNGHVEAYLPGGMMPRRLYYSFEDDNWTFRSSLLELVHDSRTRELVNEMELKVGGIVHNLVEPPYVKDGRIWFPLVRGMILGQTLEA